MPVGPVSTGPLLLDCHAVNVISPASFADRRDGRRFLPRHRHRPVPELQLVCELCVASVDLRLWSQRLRRSAFGDPTEGPVFPFGENLIE